MEIKTLTYFLAVAQEQSISKAAEKVHLTQPALSRQLQMLESEIGVKLFERGKKTLLTEEGRFLRNRAEQIIALEEITREELSMRDKNIIGNINISCTEIEASGALEKLAEEFRQTHPMVSFDINFENTTRTKEYLSRGKTDLALFQEPVETNNYEIIRLDIKRKWGLLMRADDKLSQLESISRQKARTLPLIIPERQETQNMIANWLDSDISHLQTIATYNLFISSYLVSTHKGYSVTVSGIAGILDPAQFKFIPFSPVLETNTFICWDRNRQLDRATMSFIEFLKGKYEL
ncbi:MAG: LysR family transcriptional regulator [Clostridia bacterium]|nr:LysR family transcriptional regulator [Clostridia bacterium]